MTTTTTTTEEPALVQAACRDCCQTYLCDSILLSGIEMGPTVATRCHPCQIAFQRQEARQAAAERRRRIQAEINTLLPVDILETDPDYPGFKRELWQIVSRWRPSREKLWLFLHGPADRCKTRCLALYFQKLMWANVRCSWATAGQIQEAARERNRFGNNHDTTLAKDSIREWLRVPYLFIDDIGKNDWPRDFESLFFQILDHRKTRRLPIIFSSNAHPDALGLLISDLNRDPIIGRLLDRTTILTIS